MPWNGPQWTAPYTRKQSQAHITRSENASRPIHTLFPMVLSLFTFAILASC